MEIKQRLIPVGNKSTRPGYRLVPKYITVHETDNPSKGAGAKSHANLQFNGNSRTASWHYSVDDNEIWQSIPDNEVSWHAGDGGSGTGNRQSLSVEICVNSDSNFNKAKENAVWLIKYLMDKHNIPISHVVPHNKWSGKNCPRHILPHWGDFLNQIRRVGNVAPVSTVVEDMYDLVLLKGYELDGLISSKHPEEINSKVTWAMKAHANCVLLTKRGFNLRQLQKTLNDMYPPEEK